MNSILSQSFQKLVLKGYYGMKGKLNTNIQFRFSLLHEKDNATTTSVQSPWKNFLWSETSQ